MAKVNYKKKASSEKAAEIKEIYQKLEDGVRAVFNTDSFKMYLKTVSKFHSYSINNLVLIFLQKPDATQVAGFSTWKSLGRTIKKGEKAIRILAPSPFKVREEKQETDSFGNPVFDENGEPIITVEERKYLSYKTVNVFDLSQTEGDPLEQLVVRDLEDDVEEFEKIFNALSSVSPVPVSMEEMEDSTKGYFSRTDKKIALNCKNKPLQSVKTLVHEIAHSLLHDKDSAMYVEKSAYDRGRKELEAESTAYVVCSYLGLDVTDYSFGYILNWAEDKALDELRDTLVNIQAAARHIIDGLEKVLDVSDDAMEDVSIAM